MGPHSKYKKHHVEETASVEQKFEMSNFVKFITGSLRQMLQTNIEPHCKYKYVL